MSSPEPPSAVLSPSPPSTRSVPSPPAASCRIPRAVDRVVPAQQYRTEPSRCGGSTRRGCSSPTSTSGSAKRGLAPARRDVGFRERNEDDNRGDPWLEQRYWGRTDFHRGPMPALVARGRARRQAARRPRRRPRSSCRPTPGPATGRPARRRPPDRRGRLPGAAQLLDRVAARGRRLELTVERLDDGEVSPCLVDELRPGDVLELRGPIGGWFVWDRGRRAAAADRRRVGAGAADGDGSATARLPRATSTRGSFCPSPGPTPSSTRRSSSRSRRRRRPDRDDDVHARGPAGLDRLHAPGGPRHAGRGRLRARGEPARVRVRPDRVRRGHRRGARGPRPRPGLVKTERFGPTGGG